MDRLAVSQAFELKTPAAAAPFGAPTDFRLSSPPRSEVSSPKTPQNRGHLGRSSKEQARSVISTALDEGDSASMDDPESRRAYYDSTKKRRKSDSSSPVVAAQDPPASTPTAAPPPAQDPPPASTQPPVRATKSASLPYFDGSPILLYLRQSIARVECMCGRRNDIGFMLQCEQCFTWQHGGCVGIRRSNSVEPLPPYFCPSCRAENEALLADDDGLFESGHPPRDLSIDRPVRVESPWLAAAAATPPPVAVAAVPAPCDVSPPSSPSGSDGEDDDSVIDEVPPHPPMSFYAVLMMNPF
jgi:hypothetical protein